MVGQQRPCVIVVCRHSDDSVERAESISRSLTTEFSINDVSVVAVSAPGDHDPNGPAASLLSSNDDRVVVVVSLCPVLSDWLEAVTVRPVIRGGDEDDDDATTVVRTARVAGLSDPKVRARLERRRTVERRAVVLRNVRLRTKTFAYGRRITGTYDARAQITGDRAAGIILAESSYERISGKVRDRYDLKNGTCAMVTTDRQSGFDRMLAVVPYKGRVLNTTSAYWFEKTKHIIPNHMIDVPHPNVSIVKKCDPFPIEFVVRAYMTGSTSTSIWKNYQQGVRNYCGHKLPEGMSKNQKLEKVILTPTTKEEEHDRPISAEDIVKEGWMTESDFNECASAVLRCFALGQELASERGLVLVDTKYELGRDPATGEITIIDEMHTPDSSRYWIAASYERLVGAGKEPENVDKEFLRLWFKERCDPYDPNVVLPDAPRELVVELSRRYVELYEAITGDGFEFGDEKEDGEEAIAAAVKAAAAK